MESGVPVYHLPIGGGPTQLGKTFEILARINRERITQPISKLLYFSKVLILVIKFVFKSMRQMCIGSSSGMIIKLFRINSMFP